MKIVPLPELSLTRDSYLLVITKDYIITNTDYDTLRLLDYNLKYVRTISFPLKKFLIHYSYIRFDKRAILFEPSEHRDRLIYFDLTTFKMVVIKNKQLKSVFLSATYTWQGNVCIIVARDSKTNKRCLLFINIKKGTIKFLPIFEFQRIATVLFKFLQKKSQYYYAPEFCDTGVIISVDYDDSRTIVFINTKEDSLRTVSLDKELPKTVSGPEDAPHRIYYKDDWILLIWEVKAVIISPSNRRSTINTTNTFLLADGGITTVASDTAQFVVRWIDMNGEKPTIIKLYEACEK